jgi:hypothetical protein
MHAVLTGPAVSADGIVNETMVTNKHHMRVELLAHRWQHLRG